MLRTIAVLLLLLGLATATPVVCLCLPTDAAGLTVGAQQAAPDTVSHADQVAVDAGPLLLASDGGGLAERSQSTGSSADAPSLIATSAAAAVAMLVATTTAGLPLTMPWQLPPLAPLQPAASPMAAPAGPIWSPAPRPPR